MLIAGGRAYIANADGHDVVALDPALTVARRYDLALQPGAPPGQTPAGMAMSDDLQTLYVAESGFNDVAVVDLASGAVRGRIPTGWYPTDVAFIGRATVAKKTNASKRNFGFLTHKAMVHKPIRRVSGTAPTPARCNI